MSHAESFLAAVLADPDDDAPRLLMADWLSENGQEARAEFIQVQCVLATPYFAQHPDPHEPGVWKYEGTCGRCERRAALRRRERELLEAHAPKWFSLPGLDALAVWNHEPLIRWFAPEAKGTFDWIVGASACRGFPESIECTAAAFLAHADALTAAAPIREVRLTRTVEGRPESYELHRLAVKHSLLEAWDGSYSIWPAYVVKVLHAEWDKIDFTLPPVARMSYRGGELGIAAFSVRERHLQRRR